MDERYSVIVTIMDDEGYQHEYEIAKNLSLLEAGRVGYRFVREHPECTGFRFA